MTPSFASFSHVSRESKLAASPCTKQKVSTGSSCRRACSLGSGVPQCRTKESGTSQTGNRVAIHEPSGMIGLHVKDECGRDAQTAKLPADGASHFRRVAASMRGNSITVFAHRLGERTLAVPRLDRCRGYGIVIAACRRGARAVRLSRISAANSTTTTSPACLVFSRHRRPDDASQQAICVQVLASARIRKSDGCNSRTAVHSIYQRRKKS